jgi:TRAP-type C4-dicarboxylate transport system substrate-binding protein
MKKSKLIIVLISVIVVFFSMTACSSESQPADTSESKTADEKTYTIRFGSMNPAEDHKYSVITKAWFNYLTEKSGGRIKFQEYFQ